MEGKPILVTGIHRSGSTWVGKMIALSKRVAYINEPFNKKHNHGIFPFEVSYWYQYLNENEIEIRNCFGDLLRYSFDYRKGISSVRSYRDMAKMVLAMYRTNLFRINGSIPLVKDPLAFFLSEYLQTTFDMRVICVVRHPAAFTSSLINANWGFPFHELLKQPHLIEDYLKPHKEEIEKFASHEMPLIEEAILLWKIIYGTLLETIPRHPEWIVVRHEDLSIDPVSSFRELYGKLDLVFTPSIEKKIIQYTSVGKSKTSHIKDIRINSAKNIKNWQNRLTKEEIEYIREKTLKYWPQYYNNDDWA